MNHGYMHFTRKFIRPHAPTFILLLALQFVGMLFNFASPLLVKSLIDDVLIGGRTELFSIILLGTAAIYVISAVSTYLSGYSKGKLELVLFNDVARAAFDAVQSASMRRTQEMRVGDLLSRIVVNTRSAIAIYIQIIPQVFINTASMIIPFIIMLFYNWQLTLIVTIPALLFVLPMSFFGKRLERTQQVALKGIGLIYSFLKESLSIMPLIKVFGLEKWSQSKFDEQMKGYYDASIDFTRNSSLNNSVDSMIYGVPMILLFLFGGQMLMQDSLTIGTFTLFMSNIALVFGPVSQYAALWSYYKSSSPSFERVDEIFQLEQDIGGDEGLIIKEGKITFHDACFSYNARHILQGFNATFNKGLNYLDIVTLFVDGSQFIPMLG